MTWNGLTEIPGWMRPLQNVWFAAPIGVLAMGFLAFVFGVITFKRHIYGVYCAVITLAESVIFEELIIEKQAYTGGFNGITDYGSYSGSVHFYWVILAVTVFFFWLSRKLTTTHFGMILRSIRENELRSEFFGFEVANYKIFVFAVAAMMSAVARGLYAALNGIVSHQDIGPMLWIEATPASARPGGSSKHVASSTSCRGTRSSITSPSISRRANSEYSLGPTERARPR